FQSTPPRGRRRVGSQPLFRATPSFNPRLHAGGDGIYGLMQTGSAGFQSTPPRGRRPREGGLPVAASRFNPRLHAGGDYLQGGAGVRNPLFQSTPPRGRRQLLKLRRRWLHGFNPRLHAGGDSCSSCGGVGYMVSIHASTREATDRDHAGWQGGQVSIHASTREATVVGDDDFPALVVSIHASTREATPLGQSGCRTDYCFNPRLHAGGDCARRKLNGRRSLRGGFREPLAAASPPRGIGQGQRAQVHQFSKNSVPREPLLESSGRLGFAARSHRSGDERSVQIENGLDPEMLDPSLPVFSETIEA